MTLRSISAGWPATAGLNRILRPALLAAFASMPGHQVLAQNAPTLSVNDVSVSEGVSGGNATFTIMLTESIAADLNVDYTTSIATGDTAGVADFTATSGTATITAGATTTTFSVPIVNDVIDEAASETFTVTLSNVQVSGVTVTISDSTGTGTITDDDAAPALTFSVLPPSIGEGAEQSTVTVSTGTGSTFATSQTITIALAQTGTATETDDFTIGPRTLTLPAGAGTAASSISTTITSVQDRIDEPDETVVVSAARMTGPNTSVAVGTALTVTITDDDAAPALTFSVLPPSIGEGAEQSTVTVSTGTGSTFATSQTITITLAQTGTATETDDFTIGPRTLTRLGFGLDGSWPVRLDGGSVFTPTLELGLHHDRGDAEAGWGSSVGAGVAWSRPDRGAQVDLRADWLLGHEAGGYRERGVSGSFAWDPDPSTRRGFSLSLVHTLGGTPALLERGGMEGLAANDYAEWLGDRRMELSMGYGLGVLGDRFVGTPEVGLALSRLKREYHLGWRLDPARGDRLSFDFGVRMMQRREAAGVEGRNPEYQVGLRMNARW